MFRSARLFTPKNRRTSIQMTPLRFPGQPAEDRVRVLRQQWADFLVLPTCLVLLALYEWWRWLFSISANPLLLTMVAAVALTQTWRRRKLYRAELNQLQLNRKDRCTVRHLIELLGSEAHRLSRELVEHISKRAVPWVAQRIWHSFKPLSLSSRLRPYSKTLLSACLSSLKKTALWPNR